MFEWNIILPFSSFLPMLVPLLSAHRKFLDWSSLNRWFRLYMRSDVYEIGASRLLWIRNKVKTKTISFCVSLPFRNTMLPVLRVKNIRCGKTFCCLINLLFMYVSYWSYGLIDFLCSKKQNDIKIILYNMNHIWSPSIFESSICPSLSEFRIKV